MREGAVVLLRLHQADGQTKTRPAIILRELPGSGDFLVCGVSTQLHREIRGFDEAIAPGDVDFHGSGLKAVSLIRLGFLQGFGRHDPLGSIGFIASSRHQRLLTRLANHLLAFNLD